jgi:hypothetical protein
MPPTPPPERGTDRLGRRAKRFLAPSQKYEVWLQLVRGEATIAEAADRLEVDRSTIMRIRDVARQVRWRRWRPPGLVPAPASRIWSWPRPRPRSPGSRRRSRSWRSS